MSATALRVTVFVFLLSFLCFPWAFGIKYVHGWENSLFRQLNLAILGLGGIFAFPIICHYLVMSAKDVPEKVKSDKFVWMIEAFIFTAWAGMWYAIDVEGYLGEFPNSFMSFYYLDGEMYINEAHGIYCNAWDTLFHLPLYLYMLYCIVDGNISYRTVMLIYLGSILNSMPVYLGGAAAGRWGDTLKPAFILNLPYILFPLMFVHRPMTDQVARTEYEAQHKAEPLSSRPMDFIFYLFFLGVLCLSWIRLFVVVGSPHPFFVWYGAKVEPYLLDPNKFPLMQTINFVLCTPFYIAAMQALSHGECAWVRDFAWMFTGAMFESQFCYIPSAFHRMTTGKAAFPADGFKLTFLVINFALVIVPFFFAIRAQELFVPSSASAREKSTLKKAF